MDLFQSEANKSNLEEHSGLLVTNETRSQQKDKCKYSTNKVYDIIGRKYEGKQYQNIKCKRGSEHQKYQKHHFVRIMVKLPMADYQWIKIIKT